MLKANIDAIGGGLLGALSSLLITTGAAPGATPPPEGVPTWVGYVVSVALAFGPMFVKRYFGGEAAGDRKREERVRARADKKRERADKMRAAGRLDEAQKMEAEADALDVQADEFAARAAEAEARAK